MHDKIPTNDPQNPDADGEKPVRPKGNKKRGKPFQVVRFHSVNVPIYAVQNHGKIRYTIAFYIDGRRKRRMFADLEDAKREARLAAEKIMRGMQAQNDLCPAERESYLAAQRMLKEIEMPMVAAAEDYVQCRKLLGDVPLRHAVEDFCRRTNGVKLGVTVPEVAKEVIAAKEEDGMSDQYLSQLRSILGLFSRAFRKPIMEVRGDERLLAAEQEALPGDPEQPIDLAPRDVRVRQATELYLPASEPTAPDLVPKVKVGATTTEIFEPDEIEKLLNAAPAMVIPYLAIGAFAGLRSAELARLHWKAVNLERRLIELRADQAKTASRRIVPISDNLAAWLAPLQREGKVFKVKAVPRMASVLAGTVGLRWPQNVLRHSYISYRLAQTQDANKVALEAGNSPAIIFKHYRELVTEEAAEKWFSIFPPEGWTPPERIGERSLLTKRKTEE